VISGKRYLGVEDAVMWRSLNFLYAALAHGKDRVRLVVRYADMIADPEATLKRICDAVALDFSPRMPRAFEQLHVPVRGTMYGTEEELAEKRETRFLHLEEREALRLDDDAQKAIGRYHQVLEMFGLPPETEAAL
jgi:hypothetical protein